MVVFDRGQYPSTAIAIAFLCNCGRDSMKTTDCLLIAVSAVVLTACTSVRPATLPDGRAGYAFECSGMQHTEDECDARIAKLCPSGYEILSQTRVSVMTFEPFERILYVRCREKA